MLNWDFSFSKLQLNDFIFNGNSFPCSYSAEYIGVASKKCIFFSLDMYIDSTLYICQTLGGTIFWDNWKLGYLKLFEKANMPCMYTNIESRLLWLLNTKEIMNLHGYGPQNSSFSNNIDFPSNYINIYW